MEEELPQDFFVTYDRPILDLIAVKVGDVNLSVELPNDDLSSSRSIAQLETSNQQIRRNEEVRVDFHLTREESLSGFQKTISFDHHALSFIDVVAYQDGDMEFNLIEPGVILVTAIGSMNLLKGDILIQMTFKGTQDGRISDFISLRDAPLKAELYTTTLESRELTLSFVDDVPSDLEWHLKDVVPNPFADRTTLTLDISKRTLVDLEVFDISGRLVLNRDLWLEEGIQGIDILARDLPGQGIYGYRISSSSQTITGKLICTN